MSGEIARVLMVDDNPDDVSIVRRLLSQYRRVSFRLFAAHTPNRGLEFLETERIDAVLLDYAMPTEDGITFLRRASGLVTMPPVIVVTGQTDHRLAAEAMRNGAFDCLNKYSITPQALGLSLQQAMDRSRHEIELSRFDWRVIESLLRASSKLDPTFAADRVALLAGRLGAAVGLNDHQLELLAHGAMLHDIGKLGVRGELLWKASALAPEEQDEVRVHPVVGERICASLQIAREVGPIIRHHHERWDGTGYVDGLAGEEIPLLARIVSIADSFDAMTTDRPYREALELTEAVSRLEAGAGSQWDPELIELFVGQLSDVDEPAAA